MTERVVVPLLEVIAEDISKTVEWVVFDGCLPCKASMYGLNVTSATTALTGRTVARIALDSANACAKAYAEVNSPSVSANAGAKANTRVPFA